MAHKTFISYKYSEAQNLRDRIIKALGDDASYYKGETSDSPDLTDTSTENIKKNRHYKIFCVNGNTGFRNESRIFYFIHLQNEEAYERKESSSA